MYCSTDDVYGTAGITSSEVDTKFVELLIKGAEAEVDRLTNNTYWEEKTYGTASSGTDNTLVDSGSSWNTNDYKDMYVWIYSGTGSNQIRKINSNTVDTITVTEDWDTNPDSTSVYRVCYTGNDPYIFNELRDGDDTDVLYLDRYPLILLESVTSNTVSVTPSYLYQYKATGKLLIGTSDCEISYWTSKEAQKTIINYYYGVYPLPPEVKRLTMVCAALKVLMTQAGGTHNIPSTYSLPEGSLTIGQAYINIRGAWDMLNKERIELEKHVVKYYSVFG